jgi:hypothetical protein
MKRILIIVILLCVPSAGKLFAQTQEAQQLLLNYAKLKQLEEILDQMYKGYKILTTGYKKIKDIAEGNFNLHKVFLDGLYQVNPQVKNYYRVAEIIKYQKLLVDEYKRATKRFKQTDQLTEDEIRYILNVFEFLGKQSLKNLEELIMIITANKLRMNDGERIAAIDRIFFELENELVFVRQFNASTDLLIAQREREQQEIIQSKQLNE